MKTCKHPFYIHLFVPAVICAFAGMAWHFSVKPFVNLTSVLNRLDVTDEGLRVRGFRRDTFHPWAAIIGIDHNRLLHCVFIRGCNGRIACSSTDMFLDLAHLLNAIYQRSHCWLPSHLAAALGISTHEPS